MTEVFFEGGGHRRSLAIIRSPRARQMRLMVDPRDGAVKLTIPARTALSPALSWAQTKRAWIEAQLAALPTPRPIDPGAEISIAGDRFVVDWSPTYPRRPVRAGPMLRVGGAPESLAPRIISWLKREARTILDSETRAYAALAGVTIASVGIGDPVSRWGSCSASGALRYSWRLILAPSFVRRATVAHEVAHRVHMNHGAAFHGLVAALYGDDPAPARHWLRVHGSALHWVGRAN